MDSTSSAEQLNRVKRTLSDDEETDENGEDQQEEMELGVTVTDGNDQNPDSSAKNANSNSNLASNQSSNCSSTTPKPTEDKTAAAATNPFAFLRLDSTKSTNDKTPATPADCPGAPKTTPHEPPNVCKTEKDPQAMDVDSGIEAVFPDDNENSNNAQSANTSDDMALFKPFVQRILSISMVPSDSELYIKEVAEVFKDMSDEYWTDAADLSNTLNFILISIISALNRNEDQNMSKSLRHEDSLSCSPSAERNIVRLGTRFGATDSPFSDIFQMLENCNELKLLNYLFGCYSRLKGEERNENISPTVKNYLQIFNRQIFSCVSLFLQGIITGELNDSLQNLLLRCLLCQSFPANFIEGFINYLCEDDVNLFAKLFNPVLNSIIKAGHVTSLISESFREPLHVIYQLCEMKLPAPKNRRPFCELLVNRVDWLPQAITQAMAREIVKISSLGPFLSLSAFAEENIKLADQYFPSEDISDETAKIIYQTIRHRLSLLRGDLHKIFKTILVNADTRENALEYLSSILKLNVKKAAMQVDETLHAGDGCMLNLLGVFYELASKVTLDKINPNYPFHPKSRVNITQESRLLLRPEQLQEFEKTIDTNFEIRFPTECFFLTVHCQHLALVPALQRHLRRMGGLQELERLVQQTEQTEPQWRDNPVEAPKNRLNLRQWKLALKKLKKSRYCGEAVLFDETLLSQALFFCAKQFDFIISIIFPNGQITPNYRNVPNLFGALPEFYIEDIVDLILFLLQHAPDVVLQMAPESLPHHVLGLCCNFHLFKNPFLSAKLVETLFYFTPQIQPAAQRYYRTVVEDPLSSQALFPSLIKFYSDVESTGSHTEFFDKFSIRYHIQVIFKSIWMSPFHCHSIVEYCNAGGAEFVRFVNMLINDTTFLLDESLEGLRRIHETQILSNDPHRWSQLTREQQQDRLTGLSHDERMVKSSLQLARVTVDMFDYMTVDIKRPFLKDQLGDRLAAMLNYNLLQLCGPKCRDLRVKSPERYSWDPRQLLNQLINIYLHLDSDELANAVVKDERSYSKDLFDDVINRITRSNIKSISSVEQFKLFADRVHVLWKENLKNEEIFGEIPDEFADPLMGTLMRDPVKLPSGHVVDRGVIMRHLLNTPTDPFTRQPMDETKLAPETALKQRIEEWIKLKRSQSTKK